MGSERHWLTRFRVVGWMLLAVPAFVGCTSESGTSGPDVAVNTQGLCKSPARSHEKIPMLQGGGAPSRKEYFNTLLARVDAQCSECHRAPDSQGGFQYTSDHAGLKEAAPRMAVMASQGSMPPLATPEQTRVSSELGCALSAWVEQDAPETAAFDVKCGGDDSLAGTRVTYHVSSDMTDLGHCVPYPSDAEAVGSDPEKDAFFAGLTELPRYLSQTDTDIATFDTLKLARHGTFAFVPTYTLFSDDAKKLRLVHVPAGKAIEYEPANADTGTPARFKIPSNTRFYKTFFKEVTDEQGRKGYRRIETRLILTRERWQDAIFGTYLWNDAGTEAELHDLRYRDGTSFSDRVLVYTTDPRRKDTRNYAIPGRHRCVNCHMGSEGQNFLLGFTPLEINRRPAGEGGLDPEVEVMPDELSQVDRLIRYGVIRGLKSADELPKLEDFKSRINLSGGHGKGYRNEEELALQAYFIGNCSQCHIPHGFAVQSNPSLARLDFSAGGAIPGFDTNQLESNGRGKLYVDLRGDYERDMRATAPASTLYQRVLRDVDPVYLHMPANVPGRDCRASLVVARWIASLERPAESGNPPEMKAEALEYRLAAADAAVAEICKETRDVRWIAEDFTDRQPWQPRNPDWKTQILPPGPFSYLRSYPITDKHRQLARQSLPTNFWVAKSSCDFDGKEPPNPVEPWMVDTLGDPKQPWGELYQGNTAATVFQGICANCHNRLGDGQSGAAKALVGYNGARVANFRTGLFGHGADGESHLKAFEDVLGPDGAAYYMIFMASGGTRVQFTPEFMQAWVRYGEVDIDFSGDSLDWGRWGANMLGAARGACDLIRAGKFGTGSRDPNSGNPRAIGGTTLWTNVCTLDNPLTEAIRRNTDPAVTAEWLRRAEFNVGVMAYFYLKDHLSQGQPPYLLRSECEKRGTSAEPSAQ